MRTVKVGSALFTATGPGAIRRLRALGFDVMLDLKFLDIPATVEHSCRAAARHGVRFLTVHASGEPAMLEAAARGVRGEARRARRPLLLGVTVLTSVASSASAQVRAAVLRLAERALRSGCDGIVASAQEAAALRSRFGRRLYLVCPGIRSANAARDDHSRVASPAQAVAAGADAIVVGRPITGASDPRAAARMILRAMEGQHVC